MPAPHLGIEPDPATFDVVAESLALAAKLGLYVIADLVERIPQAFKWVGHGIPPFCVHDGPLPRRGKDNCW